MYFEHASSIWRDFPDLVPGVLYASGITADMDTGPAAAKFTGIAAGRLSGSSESEFPEIQAWRRAFARLGLKPTQYRCASEALLRRLRKEGALPRLHPVIDLCNAISMAYAIPVAVLDVARIAGHLRVRYAAGDERYITFGGDVEQPGAGEVIFADADGYAHARRWTNRQSGRSSVQPSTREILVVAEALHPGAQADTTELITAISAELSAAATTGPVVLTAQAPRFTWQLTRRQHVRRNVPEVIAEDDPRKPDVRALLQRHREFALGQTPPEHSFALDVDGLLDPAIAFYSYRDGGTLLGVGALKELDPGHGEIKSMHTSAQARGRGVGRAMLSHLLTVARDRGFRQVSLETGTMAAFAPARSLYASAGFVSCGPFADYRPSEDNCFMTMDLATAPRT